MKLAFLGAAREVTGSCHLLECAVIFTGFQALGTLGRRFFDGARTVRLLVKTCRCAARIHTVGGLSAHADRDGLRGWLRGFRRAPERTFIVRGEAETALGFAALVRERLGREAEAPLPGWPAYPLS